MPASAGAGECLQKEMENLSRTLKRKSPLKFENETYLNKKKRWLKKFGTSRLRCPELKEGEKEVCSGFRFNGAPTPVPALPPSQGTL